ncbi:hypothetical protein OUZ56_022167 [Daphnia magna]|uniref:Uncharacterized protein n=1 Tax=Daphnia magna TaxID=35525 RepID=A0ABR0AVJ3_9CRUS|nr:hypothetical protein OUZ56_022167 [Daphnia magna]
MKSVEFLPYLMQNTQTVDVQVPPILTHGGIHQNKITSVALFLLRLIRITNCLGIIEAERNTLTLIVWEGHVIVT